MPRICETRSRYQTSEFPNTSEFSSELPTHNQITTYPKLGTERLVFSCRTTSASTAPRTPRRMCCPTHCAIHHAQCQPLSRALSGWSRSPPPKRDTPPCKGLCNNAKQIKTGPGKQTGPRWACLSASTNQGPPKGRLGPSVRAGERYPWVDGHVSDGVLVAADPRFFLEVFVQHVDDPLRLHREPVGWCWFYILPIS